MSDTTDAGARKEIVKNLVAEAVRDEVTEEIKPQLEALKQKRDELKMLRRELTNSVEELREQAEDLREARRDAERVNQSGNTGDSSSSS